MCSLPAPSQPAGLLPYMGKPLRSEAAGISPRDVTAYNSPRIWIKKFHFFLVGFQPRLQFLESEVSETTQRSPDALHPSATIGCVEAAVREACAG